MKLVRSCVLAFAMYSHLPMPKMEWTDDNLSYAFSFFPAVGAAVGLILFGWMALAYALGFGVFLTAAGCLLIPFLVTGGIHLDGFCDTSDALGSHQSRERKLEILKDSHIGAFALIACVLYLIAFFAVWCEAVPAESWRMAAALALIPVYSRSWSGMGVVTIPNARGSGLLATFTNAAAERQVRASLGVWIVVTAAAFIALVPLAGSCMAAAGAALFFYYRWKAKKEFGGITGDLAGWFLQLCELGCLLAAVVGQSVGELL